MHCRRCVASNHALSGGPAPDYVALTGDDIRRDVIAQRLKGYISRDQTSAEQVKAWFGGGKVPDVVCDDVATFYRPAWWWRHLSSVQFSTSPGFGFSDPMQQIENPFNEFHAQGNSTYRVNRPVE